MSPTQQNRLTSAVKRFLDLIWLFFLGVAIVWPIVVVIIGMNIPTDPLERHTDISGFLSFKVFAETGGELASASSSQGELLLSGRGEVLLNNTNGDLAWWVSGAFHEVFLLIFLFGLGITRRLFASLKEGHAFADGNAERMKNIGYVFLLFNAVAPVLQYVGGRILLGDITMNTPGVQLYPAFEFSIGGIFAGLAIIVLAGVLREAIAMRKEHELTI